MPQQLTKHFTLLEFTRSQQALRLGIANTPNALQEANLYRVALLLEQVRTALDMPLHVDSGYRCPSLNAMVGGAPTSAHLEGRAADVIPVGLDLRVAFGDLQRAGLTLDQCILECDAWLHIAVAPLHAVPRREYLLASGSPGRWVYTRAPPAGSMPRATTTSFNPRS